MGQPILPTNTLHRWLEVFTAAAVHNVHRFDAPDLIRAVVLLGHMGARPEPQLMQALFSSTAGALRATDPAVLAQLTSTLQANPHAPTDLWLEAYIGAAQDALPRFTKPQLQAVISGLSSLCVQRRTRSAQRMLRYLRPALISSPEGFTSDFPVRSSNSATRIHAPGSGVVVVVGNDPHQDPYIPPRAYWADVAQQGSGGVEGVLASFKLLAKEYLIPS